VYCIDGGNQTGLGGVTVTSCAGSVITDSAGNYVFSDVASGACEVCVTVPANCVGDRCITITVTDFAENNGVDFSFTGCCSSPPPGCCPPPNPFFGLGAAGQFAVLGLSGADVVISAGATLISGDVGLGPNDTGDLLKATITGTLFLNPTAKPDIHPDLKVTGGIVNQDLSAASASAISASATLASLAPTQTYGNINSSKTFVGNGGINVIALDSVNLVKGKIVIQGSASDVFVFNVKGGFNFSSSQMQLVGGVTFNNVLWNFPVSGTGDIDIFKDVTVAYGIFLAPKRNVTIDHTVTTGEVLAGGQIRIHSGATEGCPCP